MSARESFRAGVGAHGAHEWTTRSSRFLFEILTVRMIKFKSKIATHNRQASNIARAANFATRIAGHLRICYSPIS